MNKSPYFVHFTVQVFLYICSSIFVWMDYCWLQDAKKKNTLDDIVRNLPYDPKFQFPFSGKNAVSSPAYLLPVLFSQNNVTGFVAHQGKSVEISFGFCQIVYYLSRYYIFKTKDFVIQKKPLVKRLYLPLRLTEYNICIPSVRVGGGDEYISFPAYGLHGTTHEHPLVLVSEHEEGLIYSIPYRNRAGRLQITHLKSNQVTTFSEQEFYDFIRSVRSRRIPTIIKPKVDSTKRIDDKSSDFDWQNPKSIVAYLDQYVVGQDHAKRVTAVIFSNYMTQVKLNSENLKKENFMLIGPSGSGKTYMLSLLAKKVQLPFAQAKLTGKSSAGYVGENLSSVFEQISTKTDQHMPYGIVFFDEIDKLSMYASSNDFFGSRLQDELIGWLEETIITTEKKSKQLNTKKLLFVVAGAFCGLEKIIAERLGQNGPCIGFHAQENQQKRQEYNLLLQTLPEDLIKYGLKPELVGRLSALGLLNPLTIDEKIKILTTAKESALEGYKNLVETKGYQLQIEPEVLRIIAERCPLETGARALNPICSDLFTNLLYEPEMYADKDKLIKLTPELADKLMKLYKKLPI